MAFRIFVGFIMAVLGTIALAANSYLLGSSALAWAHEDDWYQRAALAAGGAIVPFFLALTPILLGLAGIAKTRSEKFSRGFFVVILWLVFFGYNFFMGTSNIAKLREDKVAEHNGAVEKLDITRDRRKQLRDKLAGLPAHRPSGTVSAEIEAVKISKPYTNSSECTDPTTKQQRETCQTFERLKGELAAAEEADKTEADLAKMDDAISTAKPMASGGADPFVEGASAVTKIEAKWIRVLLSMMTPFVLELIGASAWKFAALLFGWKLRELDEDEPASRKKAQEKPDPKATMIPTKEGMDRGLEASLGQITHQRRICENFFKQCVRFSADGHLPERDWYEHYQVMCERSRDVPLPIESFRRIAAVHVPSIQQLGNGQTYYSGVLPLIASEA